MVERRKEGLFLVSFDIRGWSAVGCSLTLSCITLRLTKQEDKLPKRFVRSRHTKRIGPSATLSGALENNSVFQWSRTRRQREKQNR